MEDQSARLQLPKWKVFITLVRQRYEYYQYRERGVYNTQRSVGTFCQVFGTPATITEHRYQIFVTEDLTQ
jgi:hypothetical protein